MRSGEKSRVKTKFMEDWIDAGQIAFPDNPRVEVWNTLEELLEAIQREDVPMCGWLPVGKSFLIFFALLVGAAMCSTYLRGVSHSRWP
jgi:hypothetical protein